jgi:hypothetical protein
VDAAVRKAGAHREIEFNSPLVPPVNLSVPLLELRVVQVPLSVSFSVAPSAERVSMTPLTTPSPATLKLAARVCHFQAE